MSEYAHSPSKAKYEADESTLFDDDFLLEQTVDKLGVSYSEASARLGIETPHYERPVDSNEGVSVELGARALAISNIMDTYNQLNKLAGASQAERFAARYPRLAEGQEAHIEQELLSKYGPGRAYATDPEKLVRKVSTTARRGNGAKR